MFDNGNLKLEAFLKSYTHFNMDSSLKTLKVIARKLYIGRNTWGCTQMDVMVTNGYPDDFTIILQ